jgi:hypothetical protein
MNLVRHLVKMSEFIEKNSLKIDVFREFSGFWF